VIDDIASCDAIASSSLHGVITANAYGIPAAWLEFSSKIGGDGMKYIDYFQSVDCGIDTSVNCRDLPAIQVLIDRVATHLKASFRVDVSGLLENCPFPCNLVR
jgi:pyruvyltransferase